MHKRMLACMVISAIVGAISLCFYKVEACLIVALVFLTVFYNLAIRLIVRALVSLKKRPFDFKSGWLKEKKPERRFYKAIGIKTWKNFLPLCYGEIDLRDGLLTAIDKTCFAEIMASVTIPLCYLPIIPVCIFGDTPFIVLFSSICFISGTLDYMTLCVQRYNRFRLLDAYNSDNGRFLSLTNL